MSVRIINADVLDGLAQLEDESVHCAVTSPPYWGLRDYGADGQIGLEPTLSEHIDKLVQVFREVRRVMRSDATLWLNYGDGYAGTGKSGGGEDGERRGLSGYGAEARNGKGTWQPPPNGLKPKDLLMMPERLAIALQEDGWWVRSRIIWHKPNPMPESVTDRPTKSHEHIWLLSKAPRYYYDAEAIRERADNVPGKMPDGWDTGAGGHGSFHRNGREKGAKIGAKGNANGFRGGSYVGGEPGPRTAVGNVENETLSRNARDVWTIATASFAEAHFATFPPELAERCIKAGTSEKGCCAECGAPWIRETSVSYENPGNRTTNGARSLANREITAGFAQRLEKRTSTTGWRASCTCNAGVAHCTVLDPFGGAGTTGLVADRLQRNAILIELNPEYAEMARRRIEKEAGLFTSVSMTEPAPAQPEREREPSLLSLIMNEAAE